VKESTVSTTTPQTSTTPQVSLEQLDPTTLVIADNVRLDPRLDKHFLASIRERGVLEPVVGHRTADGTVVVEYGQRRTLAAREVGQATIPVMVRDTAPTTADRLIDQWVENEHRAALTNRERVHAVQQMALEGLTVGQIAKRTATAKTAVEAATKVAASQAATEAVDQLTLEQAAVLAEFDTDQDAISTLLGCAARGYGFDHAAQRLRDNQAEHAALTAAADRLRQQGITVVEQPDYRDNTTKTLRELRTADDQPIDPDKHAADCPGHVTWLMIDRGVRYYDDTDDTDEDDGDLADDADPDAESAGDGEGEPEYPTRAVHGCTGWADHGHLDAYAYRNPTPATKAADLGEAEREAAKAARRHVIQSNKDWQAATKVRREWLRRFGSRKTAPTGAEAFLARVVSDRHTQRVGAHELLGTSQAEVAHELLTATPKRALHLALALALASWEQSTTKDTWRQTYQHDVAEAALTAMCGWGYELSDIETRLVAGTSHQPG
jgi:ParB family chromosome partitioning protein